MEGEREKRKEGINLVKNQFVEEELDTQEKTFQRIPS